LPDRIAAVTEDFTTEAPIGAVRSDMKLVEVSVTWNAEQEFQVDEDSVTEGRLGSGSIVLRVALARYLHRLHERRSAHENNLP
jgi:hypothetical protein